MTKNNEETLEEIKARLQLQLDYACQFQNKDNLSVMYDNLHKARSMFSNVSLDEAMEKIQRLKDGYLC